MLVNTRPGVGITVENAKLGQVRSDTQDGLYSVWEKVQHKMNRVRFEKGHCWVKFGRRGLGGPAGLSLLFPFEGIFTSAVSQIHDFATSFTWQI